MIMETKKNITTNNVRIIIERYQSAQKMYDINCYALNTACIKLRQITDGALSDSLYDVSEALDKLNDAIGNVEDEITTLNNLLNK